MSFKTVSPITGKNNVTEVSKIEVKIIIQKYKDDYGIDVSHYFDGLDEIIIYCCNDTGYKFYYPANVSGDAKFYESLYGNEKNLQWAYQNNKWEHLFSDKYLDKPGCLLDIGCGGGDFLKLIRKRSTQITGLETNYVGINLALEKELNIVNETVENHALKVSEFYDVVTVFQVLEHIVDVKTFLTSCLTVLKRRGKLIIAVPNNQSFLQHDPELPLNMPPHHVGLWDRESLESLAKFFDMTLIRTEIEPLQEKNIGWYKSLMEKKYIPNRVLRSIYYKLGFSNLAKNWLVENRTSILGHTVLSVFEKN